MPDLDPRIILAQRQLPTLADMQDEQQKRQIQEQEVELRRQEILARRDAIIEAAQRRNQVAQPKPLTPKDQMEAYDLRVKQATLVGNLLEGATDDDSYEQAKQGIAQIIGPDYVQHLPQTFDPTVNARLVAQGKALVAKAAAQQDYTLGPGQTRFGQGGAVIASVPATEKTAGEAKPGTLEYYMTSTYGPHPTKEQQLQGRKEFNQSDDKAQNFAASDVTKLTPAGIDLAAVNLKKRGVMIPLGMGDKSNRQAIINRAATLTDADIARIEATGGDIAANAAGYGADAGSLKKLQAQRDAIGAFENTAKKNIDIFLETAGKVVDTGSPLANSAARTISGKVLGSPDQAAYETARRIAINEVAKITNNPTLAGQLSDQGRKEVESFNPDNATLAQSVRVMRILKRDMQNRTDSLDEALADVRTRIGGASSQKTDTTTTTQSSPGGLSYADYLKSKGKK